MATITLRNIKGSPLTNTEVDNNFTNLNTDKYESGDDIQVGSAVVANDLSVFGEASFSTSPEVTAAAGAQADATALTSTFNIVTVATANAGVKLPDVTSGKYVIVVNDTDEIIKVYPESGESIDTLATNASLELRARKALTVVGASNTKWNSFKTAPDVAIFDSTGTRLN